MGNASSESITISQKPHTGAEMRGCFLRRIGALNCAACDLFPVRNVGTSNHHGDCECAWPEARRLIHDSRAEMARALHAAQLRHASDVLPPPPPAMSTSVLWASMTWEETAVPRQRGMGAVSAERRAHPVSAGTGGPVLPTLRTASAIASPRPTTRIARRVSSFPSLRPTEPPPN